MAAAAAAAVVLVAGASAITGAEGNPREPSATVPPSGLRPSWVRPTLDSQVDLSDRLQPPPAALPAGQRSGSGLRIGGTQTRLTGPTLPLAHVHIDGAPATMLGVRCTASGQPPSLCVLALTLDQTLREATSSSLLAVLPLPRRDDFTGPAMPAVSRISIVDEFDLETVLMDVASVDVGTLSVRFTTGDYSYATRFSAPGWDAALFVLVSGHATPAALTYMTDGMILDRRVLFTATP